MRVAAIVPAAGIGRRLGCSVGKPYIKIGNKPLLAHTLINLSMSRNISRIIVSVNSSSIEKTRKDIVDKYKIKNVKLVRGGRRRADSVYNALKKVSCDIDYVLIHDGARPFITDDIILSSLKAAKRFGAAVVCVPVKATLKSVNRSSFINRTADRRFFWEAQTPQTFKRDLIERAYRLARKKRVEATDDSMLVERLGVKPKVVLGSYGNIKITTREDLELARILIRNANNRITEKPKN